MFHQSTHTHTHTLTSSSLTWHSPKIRVDNISLPFFNHPLPKFEVSPVFTDFKVEADWLKRAAPQMEVTLLARRSVTRSCTLPPRTARQQGMLREEVKAGICRVSRTDADLPMRIFKNILYELLNKTLTSHRTLFPRSNLDRAASIGGIWIYFKKDAASRGRRNVGSS